MKKTGLFKIIMFVILGILVVTWLVPASYFNAGELSDLGMYRIGFFDFFQLLFGTFQFSYFLQIFILLVCIGAFYGVLSKTGKYRAYLERVASKFKGKEVVFLLVVSFLIAAITATLDFGLSMFIFIPAIISIILLMGYDKVTALVATFGSMLVGTIGAVISSRIVGTINEQLTDVTLKTGLYYKLGLFVGALAVLFYFLATAKKAKGAAAKEEKTDIFLGEKVSNKCPVWPILLVFGLLFVVMVLGCTAWSKTFGVEVFANFNTAVTEFTIKDVTIFAYILGTVSAFGEWAYAEMAVMCLLASVLIGKIYKLKFSEVFANMAEGAKKLLGPACLVMLTYAVVYFAGNTMSYPTIAGWLLGLTKKFNLFFSSLSMILGSALHVDMLYVANYVIPQLAYENNQMVVGLLIQSLYGLTMFAVPTSSLLVLGLSYLGVSYKEWIKSSWKLILELFVVVLIVLILAFVL